MPLFGKSSRIDEIRIKQDQKSSLGILQVGQSIAFTGVKRNLGYRPVGRAGGWFGAKLVDGADRPGDLNGIPHDLNAAQP